MLAVVRVFLKSRSDTALEILALRQQVAVLKLKRSRPVVTLGSWSIPPRNPGPRFEIRCQRDHFSGGDGSKTEADEHTITLAKWHREEVDRKLSSLRDARPLVHGDERSTGRSI